jgi:lipopolysaccharide/colanic/teichoic acid biosynthesis glycosyltransferase
MPTRLFDIAAATLLGSVLLPLGVAIAVAIRVEDGGPVFFSQQRGGKDGEAFRLWKFRSLQTGPKDAERPGDYVTRVGRFLRRWGLDELPQLWNVIRGDMSLVGPRPAPLDQIDAYGHRERIRLQVRPGLTGWAQIHGRNAIPWSERIEYDLWYVENRSLALDLRILFRTPIVLWTGRGVYGRDGRNAAPKFASRSSDARSR